MDPVGLLPVDVRDLLWSDAVEHRDLFRQVQQSQLLQVQGLIDCRTGRRSRHKRWGTNIAHRSTISLELLVWPTRGSKSSRNVTPIRTHVHK